MRTETGVWRRKERSARRWRHIRLSHIVATPIFHLILFLSTSGHAQEPPNVKAERVWTIPFEDHNGAIVLRCRINDSPRELRLLFDTGADGMAVSEALGEEIGLEATLAHSASVVGGEVQIRVSTGNTVHIGDFAFPHQGIALFPKLHKDVDGVLGNTLLRKYIVRVDYDRRVMALYTPGRHDFGTTGATVPITFDGSSLLLPVTLAMNGGKRFEGRMLFDTGAAYNLILFRPFVRRNRLLVDGFLPLAAGQTMSMGVASPTYVGLAESMRIGEGLHTDGFLLSLMAGSGQNREWTPAADGSLGVGIIGRYNFTVDLPARRIHFEPNSRYGASAAFVLAGHVLHFDLAGELYIGSIANPEGLYHKVAKINGHSVDKWLKKKNVRKELTKEWKKTDVRIETEDARTFRLVKDQTPMP